MKVLKFSACLLLISVLSSCLNNDQVDKNDERTIREYISQTGLNTTRDDSGIYYAVLNKNSNGVALTAGNVVELYFSVSVLGNNPLDKQEESDGLPVKVQFGTNTITPVAIDMGLSLMNTGDTYRFFVPSSLGFGTFSTSGLPQNSILDITLTVVDSYPEEEENGRELNFIDSTLLANNKTGYQYYPDINIYLKEISHGTGNEIKDGDQVKISYKGLYFNGDQFDSNDSFFFTAGSNEIISGLGQGIKLLTKGGNGVFLFPSSTAYGANNIIIPRQFGQAILPYSILEFDITVL